MFSRIYQWVLDFFYVPPMVVMNHTISTTTEEMVSIDAAMTAEEAARITASAETQARVKALQEENEKKRIEKRKSMLQKILAEIAEEAKLEHTKKMYWYNQQDFPAKELGDLGYDVFYQYDISGCPIWTVSWANVYERLKLENESQD